MEPVQLLLHGGETSQDIAERIRIAQIEAIARDLRPNNGGIDWILAMKVAERIFDKADQDEN